MRLLSALSFLFMTSGRQWTTIGVRYVLLMIIPGSSSVIGQVSDERTSGGNRGIDFATSANDRVMAPEPIGSHPIPEPDALFIDQVIGQVKAVGA